MVKTLLILLLLLLGFPTLVRAQDVPETVVSWDVSFFAAGVNPDTGAPLQTTNYLRSTSQCNQATVAVPAGTTTNPTSIRLADPDNAARDCILGPNTAGNLMALPLGSGLFAVVKARGATLTSARSAASNPFTRAVIPMPPVTPAGLRVLH